MMASKAEADVNVIALIGERGREVRDFLERDLSPEGRAKSVVRYTSTCWRSRVSGTFLAMTIAEYFRAKAKTSC